MAEFDAVIFDLDGTLADTLTDLSRSLNAACGHFGFPTHSTEEHLRYVNSGAYDFVKNALPKDFRDEKTLNTVFEWYKKYYDLHFLDHTLPFTGIKEVVDAFYRENVKTAVLTNKAHSCTLKVIERFFGAEKFGFIQGNVSCLPPKPSPVMTQKVFEGLKIDPKKDKIAMVGDSDVDIMTARNAGITAVSVTWGYRKREYLETLSPDMIFDNPAQLLTLLG